MIRSASVLSLFLCCLLAISLVHASGSCAELSTACSGSCSGSYYVFHPFAHCPSFLSSTALVNKLGLSHLGTITYLFLDDSELSSLADVQALEAQISGRILSETTQFRANDPTWTIGIVSYGLLATALAQSIAVTHSPSINQVYFVAPEFGAELRQGRGGNSVDSTLSNCLSRATFPSCAQQIALDLIGEDHLITSNTTNTNLPTLYSNLLYYEYGAEHRNSSAQDYEKLNSLLINGTYAIISAGRNTRTDAEANLTASYLAERYRALRQDLIDAGYDYTEVIGRYDDVEESIMVIAHHADRAFFMN
jgi:hypothetical protein